MMGFAMKQEDHNTQINRIIVKCWSDESFKKNFFSDPAAILKAEGVTIPQGLVVKAFENTGKLLHLVIPVQPTGLSDDDLDQVVGGGCMNTSICGPFY
jgi:hypothetical protein